MAEAKKKFYWFKMKEDFFTQPKIRKLRKIAGGDTLTIIYLKMQLLSLKTDGILYFEGIEDDFVEDIALRIDEDVENTRITIMYLMKQNLLLSSDNDGYALIETMGCIGSESESAERVRRFREKQKNVKLLQCNTDETESNTEIRDKEIRDKESLLNKKEADFFEINLIELFETEFKRPLSQREVQTICDWQNEYEHDQIVFALRNAIIYQKTSIDYIGRILFNEKNKEEQC